jgi:hypothetical protein
LRPLRGPFLFDEKYLSPSFTPSPGIIAFEDLDYLYAENEFATELRLAGGHRRAGGVATGEPILPKEGKP